MVDEDADKDLIMGIPRSVLLNPRLWTAGVLYISPLYLSIFASTYVSKFMAVEATWIITVVCIFVSHSITPDANCDD